MILIIRTHRDYEDIAWRRYDEVFCEKAAVTENRKWDAIDPDLYNCICSGKAIALQAKLALVPGTAVGIQVSEGLIGSQVPYHFAARDQQNICLDWNMDKCTYNPCKYRDICSECSGHHPSSLCKTPVEDQETGSGCLTESV